MDHFLLSQLEATVTTTVSAGNKKSLLAAFQK